jgi:hypothetical protein
MDVMDPNFYRSWEHLEALIDGLEEQNKTGPRPAGGQQCGMDKSWDLPHNRLSMKRDIDRYCRAMREVAKHLKEDQNE